MRLALATVAAAAACVAGCYDEHVAVYRDFPVVFDTGEDTGGDVTPTVTLGVYEDGAFRSLEAGGDAEIINGTQGGWWIHFALRVTGMERVGRVAASMRRNGTEGQEVGAVEYRLRLSRTKAGFLEAQTVPVPFDPELTNDQILDLVGEPGHVDLTFSDEAASVTTGADVVFTYP